MTDTIPPDSSSKARPAASGAIAQEVAEWLKTLRQGWTEPLSEPLEHWVRFCIAGMGTFTWLLGVLWFTAVTEPRFANFVFIGVTSDAVLVVLTVLVLIATLVFGWLIAFKPRRSGPIRLFLDGLLLPAATLTIIALSVGRMPSAPPESAPIPEDRLNGAQTVDGSGLDEPQTGAESASDRPLLSDGGRQ